jgi:hypothetical protein
MSSMWWCSPDDEPMNVHLHRTARATVRVKGGGMGLRAGGPHPSASFGVALRGVFVGLGIGFLLIAGLGIASTVAIGVLALGTALLSWDT